MPDIDIAGLLGTFLEKGGKWGIAFAALLVLSWLATRFLAAWWQDQQETRRQQLETAQAAQLQLVEGLRLQIQALIDQVKQHLEDQDKQLQQIEHKLDRNYERILDNKSGNVAPQVPPGACDKGQAPR